MLAWGGGGLKRWWSGKVLVWGGGSMLVWVLQFFGNKPSLCERSDTDTAHILPRLGLVT